MKAKHVLFVIFLLVQLSSKSQPPKTPPKEFPTTIPRHELGKIMWNVSQINKTPFVLYISTIEWRGARIWTMGNSATVDSVTAIKFNTDGTVTWQKQGWEFVNKTAGTYTINGNNISIQFEYVPYKHVLQGSFNNITGKISGTFIETRSLYANAPSAYTPVTIAGEFNFYKK